VKRRTTLVGVEITQESVRAAEVTLGAFPTLVACGEVSLPSGAARDSEVRDRDAVSLALENLWESAGIGGRRVVLGVGGRSILVREVDIRTPVGLDLAASLPREVVDILPAPVDEVVMDFLPFEEQAGRRRGMLVAASSDAVERMIASFSRTRSDVRSVDLVAFGLARVAGRLGRSRETAMIVHVGDHTTHVVISVGGMPRLVRTIRAEMLTSAIVRRASLTAPVPAPSVAVVTDRGGRSGLRIGAHTLGRDSDDAAEPSHGVAALADRVRETVEQYRSTPGTARIGTVFVAGAGAVAPGVESALSAALKRPLRVVGVEQLVSTRRSIPAGELRLDLVGTVGILIGARG
jgi:type IV pilus assembly protein PilM